jgi:hypothetical protein
LGCYQPALPLILRHCQRKFKSLFRQLENNEITTPKSGSGDSSLWLPCMNDDLVLFGTNGVFELQDGTQNVILPIFITAKATGVMI